MTLDQPITIRIERPADALLGHLMNDIRSWLDANKIEPAGFKPIQSDAATGFDISFRNQAEADRFKLAFVL